jgi:hypothetical protein
MKMKLMTLAFGIGAAMAADQASAQQSRNCAPHDLIVSRLAERYGESRQSIGLAANNAVIEVFASLDSGSWTITVTAPGGPTCLIASGQHFQALAETLPNTDSPA